MKLLLSDEELIKRIQQGDHEAFETLFDRYWHSLYLFAKKLLNSTTDAQDVVQNVFIAVWEKKQQFVVTHSLQAYLFQAVRFGGLNRLKEVLDEKIDIDTVHERFLPVINDFLEAMDHDELLQAIESQVEILPERTRTIFRMSRFEQLSVREISRILGLSEQTVKNQLTLALKHLREGIAIALLISNLK